MGTLVVGLIKDNNGLVYCLGKVIVTERVLVCTIEMRQISLLVAALSHICILTNWDDKNDR